ncbi:hypothetical protein HJ014_22755 [Vibrio parahaemolyticus]|nr:hypothetical protein [Vibrio parahaemolyticus]
MIVVLGVLTIGLSNFAESIDKLSTYVKKGYSIVKSSDKLPTYPSKVHSTVKPNELSVQSDLNEISLLINNSQGGDIQNAYKKLMSYLNDREKNSQLIVDAMKWGEELYAKTTEDVVVISTNNQYKMPAFVLIFDAQTGELLLADDELGLGVTGVKVIEETGASPSALVILKYISITGTGTFGNSVKFYAIDKGQALLSLDKPYSEVNSGWSAFEKDTVEFKTRNDVVVKNGMLEIHTTGIAIVEGDNSLNRKLPEEIYIWDPKSRQFDQVKGRITYKQGLMTHIYSDIADPAGDWFTMPRRVDGNDLDDVFTEEDW